MPARRSRSRIHTAEDGVVARTGRATDDAVTTDAYLDLRAKVTDLEARIRELEAVKAKLIGACFLLSIASGWLAPLVPLLIPHH
jgi:hypothetical protein